MKRKLIALSTMVFAFFALTGITQGITPGFKFKLTGGYGTISVGDYNTYGEDMEKFLDDYSSLIEQLGWSVSREGEFKKMNWGLEFEGEAILTLGTFGIGGGFGYLRRGKETEMSISVSEAGFTMGGTIKPTFSIISLHSSFYFFVPIPPPLNIYLYAGPALYRGKITSTMTEYERETGWVDWSEESELEATATSFGFHGGVGLEIDIASNIAFFIEGKGRYAKLSGWEGEVTYTERENGGSWTESLDGTIYFYEEEMLPGRWYSTVEMDDSKPSGAWARNVEEFSVNLTGFSLRAGIVIKF